MWDREEKMISMRYNVLIKILFPLLLIISLAGCEDTGVGMKEEEKDILSLYYLNTEENGLKEISCTLENGDDPLTASYEVASRLSDTEDNKTGRYKASVYEGIVINYIRLEERAETVDFGASYQQLSPEKEILLRSAVVKSLIQIKGVDSVTFTINGEALRGTDNVPVGTMTADSFITDRNSLYSQKKKVTLYYANMDGDGLVPVETTLETKDNMSIEMAMLEMLMERPKKEGLQCPLPEKLTVYQTQIYNNVCYVDLSEEMETVMPIVKEEVKVYAIVNTLASAGNVSQVQFTIDGKRKEKLNDFEGFDQMMTCDYSLCEKKE